MKTIPLTRGLSTVVDDDVYEWASRHRWFSGSGKSGRWYAARSVGTKGNMTTVYLHRLVAGIEGRKVDLKNGDSLDNRRENLRAVTHRQNQENRAYGYGVTGYRGVRPTPAGRFAARATVGKKHHYLGTFATAEEANEAAIAGRLRLMSHSDGR